MTTMLPHPVDDATLAFPARVAHMMPPYESIPDDFKDSSNPWVRFQRTWFARGLDPRTAWIPIEVDGERLDGNLIHRHLTAIQGSFEPKHEHKMAAVAYLASQWMESLIYGPPDCSDDQMVTIGDFPTQDWLEHKREEAVGDDDGN